MKLETVGLIEKIIIKGEKEVETWALFDTGAAVSSIDIRLAKRAKLGPPIKTVKIRNPSLKRTFRRPLVRAMIKIKGIVFDTDANLQDRSHMSFPVIIGRNIIAGNFLVNAKKNYDFFKKYGGKNNMEYNLKKFFNGK